MLPVNRRCRAACPQAAANPPICTPQSALRRLSSALPVADAAAPRKWRAGSSRLTIRVHVPRRATACRGRPTDLHQPDCHSEAAGRRIFPHPVTKDSSLRSHRAAARRLRGQPPLAAALRPSGMTIGGWKSAGRETRPLRHPSVMFRMTLPRRCCICHRQRSATSSALLHLPPAAQRLVTPKRDDVRVGSGGTGNPSPTGKRFVVILRSVCDEESFRSRVRKDSSGISCPHTRPQAGAYEANRRLRRLLGRVE